MVPRSERGGDTLRGVELRRMPLPVVNGERIALEPLRTRDRQRGRRIEPTRKEHHRGRHRSFPRSIAPQNLVELQLKAYGQVVLEDPVGEVPRGELFRT